MRERSSRSKATLLRYELYEPKILLAGNVNAFEYGDHLYIRGDSESNQIRVFANENNKLEVVGVDGTTINGVAKPFIVDSSTATTVSSGAKAKFAGGLRVHLGPGDDSMDLEEAKFDDFSIVYGGTGDDSIEFRESAFQKKVVVQTFQGDDRVSLNSSSFFDELFVLPLDGDDQVDLHDVRSFDDTVIATGEGNDHVVVGKNELLGNMQLVLTQNGDDVIEVSMPAVGANGLGIYAGQGTDHVTAEFDSTTLAGEVVISGQKGEDFGLMSIKDEQRDRVFARGFEFDGEIAYEGAIQVNSASLAYRKAQANTQWLSATSFGFNDPTTIGQIEWSGSYDRETPSKEDRFVIEVYEAVLRTDPYTVGEFLGPDEEPIFRLEPGNNVNRTATGIEWSDDNDSIYRPLEIFNYSVTTNFNFEGGKIYFISIFQDLDPSQEEEYDVEYYWVGDKQSNKDLLFLGSLERDRSWYPFTSQDLSLTMRS